MIQLTFIVFEIYIVIFQVVNCGLIRGKDPLQESYLLDDVNFNNTKYFNNNRLSLIKLSNENNFARTSVPTGIQSEVKSNLKDTLTVESKGAQETRDNCQREKANYSSYPSEMKAARIIADEIRSATENSEFPQNFQNSFNVSEVKNQGLINLKNVNETMFFRDERGEQIRQASTAQQFRHNATVDTETTKIIFYDDEETSKKDSEINTKDIPDEVILQSGLISCRYSLKNEPGNPGARTMTCNERKCDLKSNSQKAASWKCGNIVCTVANDLNLRNYKTTGKPVIDCSLEDRSLISAPLKCQANEKLVNDKCRKIFKV